MTKNEQTMKRVKRISLFALIGAATAVTAVACGMHGGHMSERMMRAAAEDHLDEMMDDIDADDAQRAEWTQLFDSILKDATALKKSHDANGKALLAALKRDKVDREALHAQMDSHFDSMEDFVSKSVDKVLDAYEKLRPDQKRILLEKLETHMENK